jgi:hypothetical protein
VPLDCPVEVVKRRSAPKVGARHEHAPLRHCCVALHTFPHAPQLESSASTSVHPLAQAVSPAVAQTHAEALQLEPAGQELSQAPQCASSALTSTQVPVDAQ